MSVCNYWQLETWIKYHSKLRYIVRTVILSQLITCILHFTCRSHFTLLTKVLYAYNSTCTYLIIIYSKYYISKHQCAYQVLPLWHVSTVPLMFFVLLLWWLACIFLVFSTVICCTLNLREMLFQPYWIFVYG